jgi:TetR/AcrR family transcriptional regulator
MSRSVGQVNGSAASGRINILSNDNMTTMNRKRRTRDGLRQQLVESALVEFAAKGFDGASTRSIAERVDAHQPQINYHFTSKEALWMAAVDHLFDLLADAIGDLPPVEDPDDPLAVGRAVADTIRRFVHFAAAHPELNQIMVQEGTEDSDRARWMAERHVRAYYEATAAAWALLRGTGIAAPIDPARVYWVIVGAVSIPFVNASEVRNLTGDEPTDPAWVDAHADDLITTLLPGLDQS